MKTFLTLIIAVLLLYPTAAICQLRQGIYLGKERAVSIVGGSSKDMLYVLQLLDRHKISAIAHGSIGYSVAVKPSDKERARKAIIKDEVGLRIWNESERFAKERRS
jgi:hypothetical protein